MSQNTVARLKSCFATHGQPECVVSDNGPGFTSDEFRKFTSTNGMQHTFAALYHLSTYGLAERAVQSFKDVMIRMQPAQLQLCLTRWPSNYRLSPRLTRNRSSAEMLLRIRPKSRFDFIRRNTRIRVEENQTRQRTKHGKQAKYRRIDPGDHVLVRNFASGPNYPIIQCTGPISFTAQLSDGRVVRRHHDHLLCRVCN